MKEKEKILFKVMIILYLQRNEKCPQGYLHLKFTDTLNLFCMTCIQVCIKSHITHKKGLFLLNICFAAVKKEVKNQHFIVTVNY